MLYFILEKYGRIINYNIKKEKKLSIINCLTRNRAHTIKSIRKYLV